MPTTSFCLPAPPMVLRPSWGRQAAEWLRDCGLEINPEKSRALTLSELGRRGAVRQDTDRRYFVEEQRVGAVEIGETWESLLARLELSVTRLT